MNPQEFKFHKSRFYPVLVLESIFSHKSRHRILSFLRTMLILLTFFLAIGLLTEKTDLLNEYKDTVSYIFPKVLGSFFIILALATFIFIGEAFFRSHYLKKKTDLKIKDADNIADYFSFESSRLVYSAMGRKNDFTGIDLLKSFLKSYIGRMTMLRSGIDWQPVKEFLKILKGADSCKSSDILEETFLISQKDNRKIIFVEDLIAALFRKEKVFSDFLFKFEIKEEELKSALEWVMRSLERKKKKEGWWKRESLERVQGLAKDWAYGKTYLLDKYSQDLSSRSSEVSFLELVGRSEQIKQMELILSRRKEANVLVVGEPGVGRSIAVLGLNKMLLEGKIVSALEHRRMLNLDTDALIASTKQKGEFENLLIRVFNEAASAGNVLFVLENFPSFLNSASVLGSDITSLLMPYFTSKNLQIIAVADLDGFHRVIEINPSLMKFFEKVEITEPDEKSLTIILEQVAEEAESNSKIIFTYPVIAEIIQSADQYLTEGVMPEKAIGLLAQTIPFVLSKNRVLMQKEDVREIIHLKTKIPVGKITAKEKEKLLRLEEFLHKRVIGQNEAISAISEVMRRARAEVRDIKRPIGSFLFLGPTGVGKTETAKALAETFFEDEKNILRFDMSEYQADDALNRLIGSFEENKPGILASSLREKPYGLFLLDEFEKTNPNVLNLFLQILDEGFFTDAFGKRVNSRNIIFIATSNAGADLIWDFVKQGINPVEKREQIIDKVRGKGIFKPELLNRFDGIIIFHPLNEEHLKKIARLMLNKLKGRLKEKDVELVVNEVLVQSIAKWGYNPVFGARPMQRAIQDKIENYIAERLISGEIQRGSKIEFSDEDLRKMG